MFTRCPECETTFRVTSEALQKAGGQVRCGRCAMIFDATEALCDSIDDVIASTADQLDVGERTMVEIERRAQAQAAALGKGAEIDFPLHEEIVLETASPVDGFADEPELSGDASDLSDDEVDAALAGSEAATSREPEWLRPAPDRPDDGMRQRLWTAGVAIAAALLFGQLINHFKSPLAGLPVLGGAISGIYALVGVEIVPSWDIEQYDLIDWVAVAEPAANGQGNLIIRSRVFNAGPHDQPYPHVHLRLLDRWEKTVGSRIFAPNEYLGDASTATSMLSAGSVAEAELVIVDPGPDAYGFEIDLCLEIASRFDCATSQTFQ